MRGVSIHKTVTVAITLTADQWDLYTDMVGADEVAAVLNATLADAVNRGEPREKVQPLMEKEMYKHRAFGASDTEPRYALQDVLDTIYGE